MYATEARGLRKTYPGGVQAVKGIDVEVPEGEVFGLLLAFVGAFAAVVTVLSVRLFSRSAVQ